MVFCLYYMVSNFAFLWVLCFANVGVSTCICISSAFPFVFINSFIFFFLHFLFFIYLFPFWKDREKSHRIGKVKRQGVSGSIWRRREPVKNIFCEKKNTFNWNGSWEKIFSLLYPHLFWVNFQKFKKNPL